MLLESAALPSFLRPQGDCDSISQIEGFFMPFTAAKNLAPGAFS